MDEDCNINAVSEIDDNKSTTVKNKCKLWFRHYSKRKCSLECCTKSSMNFNDRAYLPPSVLSTVHYYEDHDPYLILLKQKKEYINNLHCLRNGYKHACTGLNLARQFSCYFELDQHMESDPDPYFQSNYNWYYTGGSLEIRNIGPQDFVFYVCYGNTIKAAIVEPTASEWKATNWNIPFQINSNIFQLDSAQLNPLIMGVRCKKAITFFNVCMIDGKFKVKKLKENLDHVPFMNFSINEAVDCVHNFATINTNHLIKLWDLQNFQQTGSVDEIQGIHEIDRFAQVVLKGNNLYYVNRTSLNVFDTRSSTSIMNMNYTSFIENNDRFSSIFTGENENEFFVTSFRNVQLIDWRLKLPVFSWSHSFTKPPYISDVINLGENNNIIATSSHISSEKLFCEYNGEMSYISRNPESLKFTFDNLKSLTNEFTMDHVIKRRLELSTTGLKFIQKENRLALLFCNVIGDLFYHEICENSTPVEFRSKIADFLNWNQQVREASITNEYCNTVSRADRVMLANDLPKYRSSPEDESSPHPKDRQLEKCLEFVYTSNYGHNTAVTDSWQHANSNWDRITELDNQPPVFESVNDWLNKSTMLETVNLVE